MSMHSSFEQACRRLVEADSFGISDLVALARSVDLSPAERAALCIADSDRPYGRRVIFNHPRLEAMVATWTDGAVCLPHDHGGAIGVVRVISGRSRHTIFQVDPASLRPRLAELALAGSLIRVGPELVHAMGDDRAEETLVTLHIYSPSIEHMIVYDTAEMRTLVVDGSCGAWVPGPKQLQLALPGLLPRATVEAALAAAATP